MSPLTPFPPPAEIAGEEMRTLVRIGFHGLFNGRPALALRLFEALTHLRPDRAFPYVGRALALTMVGRAGEAVRVLEGEGRIACPKDESITLFLGVALHFDGRLSRARQVLSSVAENAEGAALARELLLSPLRR